MHPDGSGMYGNLLFFFFVNAIKKSQLNYFSVSLVIYVGVPPVRMSSINS